MDIHITCYHTASLCGMSSQKQQKYVLQAGSRHTSLRLELRMVNRFGEQPMRAERSINVCGEIDCGRIRG